MYGRRVEGTSRQTAALVRSHIFAVLVSYKSRPSVDFFAFSSGKQQKTILSQCQHAGPLQESSLLCLIICIKVEDTNCYLSQVRQFRTNNFNLNHRLRSGLSQLMLGVGKHPKTPPSGFRFSQRNKRKTCPIALLFKLRRWKDLSFILEVGSGQIRHFIRRDSHGSSRSVNRFLNRCHFWHVDPSFEKIFSI